MEVSANRGISKLLVKGTVVVAVCLFLWHLTRPSQPTVAWIPLLGAAYYAFSTLIRVNILMTLGEILSVIATIGIAHMVAALMLLMLQQPQHQLMMMALAVFGAGFIMISTVGYAVDKHLSFKPQPE